MAALLLNRLHELTTAGTPVPAPLWEVAERLQPLLDGIDPTESEAAALTDLLATLPTDALR